MQAAGGPERVRACLCHDSYTAHQGVEHDAMNVLCLGSEIVGLRALPRRAVRRLHAQVAAADMFNGSRMADFSIVPTAIFTDPELAQVGLTEAEAREAGSLPRPPRTSLAISSGPTTGSAAT